METKEDGIPSNCPAPPDISLPCTTPPPASSPLMDIPPPSLPAPSPLLDGENPLVPLQDRPSVEESPPVPPVVLTDDLRDKIVRQVEYYFSDENLPTDEFLLKHVKRNKQGFVSIGLIASFRKMKKLVQDNSVVADALRTSDKLVVSADGKKVKRRVPLPDEDDVKARSVLVRNLSENQSVDDIRRTFEGAGSIKNISIGGNDQLGGGTVGERVQINRKTEVVIEYETADAAKNAVDSLNDRNDWRNGLRVELVKKMGKHGSVPRRQKNTWLEGQENKISTCKSDPEGNEKSTDSSGVTTEPEFEHASQEKNAEHTYGKQKGRGHGSASRSLGAVLQNKPPPGPRMPDGTRGFVMGRGRPIVQNQILKSSIVEGCFNTVQ